MKLYNAIREAYYSSEYIATLDKLHNKFIIAIDGSDTPLPNLPGLRDKFGGTGAKASSPTARMSIAYDITNDFIIGDSLEILNKVIKRELFGTS